MLQDEIYVSVMYILIKGKKEKVFIDSSLSWKSCAFSLLGFWHALFALQNCILFAWFVDQYCISPLPKTEFFTNWFSSK